MQKCFKNIFALVLIVSFVMLIQGCGSDPEFWSALAGGFSSASNSVSSSSSGSFSSEQEYLVTVSGYDTKGVMMTGQWYIWSSSQSAAKEEGTRLFLKEVPGATNVFAMAVLSP